MQRRSILLFLLFLGASAYFFPRWAEWNQNSRFDLVLAVVDKGTLAIDDYYRNTGDYAYYKGHYYSDKAPGASFLGIPVYWFYRTVVAPQLNDASLRRVAENEALAATLNPEGSGLLDDKIDFFAALTFVTFFVVAVPSALLALLLCHLLGEFLANETQRLVLTMAFALATPAFAYSHSFYGHQIAAFFLLCALYLALRQRGEMHSLNLARVGLLLSFAVITEYPTVLIAAGLGLYAVYRSGDWRKSIWLAVGGIAPLAAAAAYNWAIFETPLPVGYQYSELWQDLHQVGFLSLTGPRADALWGITFGIHRGLFFLSPFLLLAVPGFYYLYRRKHSRAEFFLIAWIVGSFFLFNGSSAMWSGGHSVGPRYLVPMLPFLILPIAALLDAVKTRWLQNVAGVLILVSFILVWSETIGGSSLPQYQPNPLMDYSLPRLAAGDIARNAGMMLGLQGWTSLAPLLIFAFALIPALFARPARVVRPRVKPF